MNSKKLKNYFIFVETKIFHICGREKMQEDDETKENF